MSVVIANQAIQSQNQFGIESKSYFQITLLTDVTYKVNFTRKWFDALPKDGGLATNDIKTKMLNSK